MGEKETDWDALVSSVNKAHSLLRRKPRSRRAAFPTSPGGILNAYREGDVSFKQAVRHLECWAQGQQQQHR